MLRSSVPFNLFWDNYNSFRPESPRTGLSNTKAQCSFENLSAIQDTSRQSFADLRFMMQSESPSKCCPCSSSGVNFFTSNNQISSLQMSSSNSINVKDPLPSPSTIATEITEPMDDVVEAYENVVSSPISTCDMTYIKSEDSLPSSPMGSSSPDSLASSRIQSFTEFEAPVELPTFQSTPMEITNSAPPVHAIQYHGKLRRRSFEALDPSKLRARVKVEAPTNVKRSRLDNEAKPKKHRFEWSAELHEHFIRAYDKISESGYPTPKQIMIEMEENGAAPLMGELTRIHVNTHLQKYELSLAHAPKRNSKFFAFRVHNDEVEEPIVKKRRNSMPAIVKSGDFDPSCLTCTQEPKTTYPYCEPTKDYDPSCQYCCASTPPPPIANT